MSDQSSALSDWTPEQIALGKQWVADWNLAAVDLERSSRQELCALDGYRAISLPCRTADDTVRSRAPGPTSGLVKMQVWFRKARQS